MKPQLKPPGTKRLKLEYDGLLSNFGFKFNLRRYIMEYFMKLIKRKHGQDVSGDVKARAYTRPLFSSTLAVSDKKYTPDTP